jgi:surface protein
MKFQVFLLVTMATLPNRVVGVFTPTDRTGLKTAVDGCLTLAATGLCPTFETSNDATENPYGAMGDWDTAAVTDMNSMFTDAVEFNADISKWDTAAVTDMNSMFTDAVEFNADISKWDTAAVTDMNSMFKGAVVFDVDISKWGTDKVTNMNFELMFDGAVAFQAKYNCPNTGGIVLNTANSNCICGKYRCQQGKDRCFSCSSICFELIDDVSVAGTTPCVQSATKVIDNACQCKTDECDVGNFCYYNICSATGINNVDEFNDYLYNQRL